MLKKTKALLLSAGFGTRLRPITLTTPKCLVEISGLPLLEHWIRHLEHIGVSSLLVNTHYLSEKVEDYLLQREKSAISIQIVHEKRLLGTAGTLLTNKDFFKDSVGLLIHADNYTKADLSGLMRAFENRPKNCILTMLTFDTPNPNSCGVVEVSDENVLIDFYEKVRNPPSNRANAAVYVFGEDFLDWLDNNGKNCTDFSTEIIPKLKGFISTWHISDPYIDIGTPDALLKARMLGNQL